MGYPRRCAGAGETITADKLTDLGVWRPSTATFFIYSPAANTVTTKQWGAVGDIPTPADYDGDHKTDIAVWRPSTATFIVFNSTNGDTGMGQWEGRTTSRFRRIMMEMERRTIRYGVQRTGRGSSSRVEAGC